MDGLSEVLRELAEIREVVRALTARVFELEQGRAATSLPKAVPPPPAVPAASSTQGAWQPLSAPLPASVPDAGPHQVASPRVPAPAPPVVRQQQPNLESRIGSQWLNRIGITALLIGVSYFLKFAIDNRWIGPAGQVAIGLFLGILVVVWSEWFRGRGHIVFSYSLKAVGIGTVYLSLWASYQVYGLVPSGVAFLAMVIVTSATVVMAWTQDAEILAAFALAGGFTTPLLLSTGQNRELELFAYVALLNVAALFLVVARPWRRLVWMSYSGTLLLYIGWYSEYYHRIDFARTAVFATLFFVIFAIASIVARNPNRAGSSSSLPIALSLLNGAVYFLQIYIMLDEIDKTSSAWVAVALAAFYIYLSRIPSERYGDLGSALSLRLLHLAMAIGFITIAIPIYLNSHWITMGWFVEAAVLLWVSARVKSELLTVFSVGALALGVVRLLGFDNFVTDHAVIFNQRMATYAVAVSVLGLLVWQGRKRGDEAGNSMAMAGSVALNLLALWALSLEVRDFFGSEITRANIGSLTDWNYSRNIGITRDFTYSALWMGYGGMLMAIGFVKNSAFIRWQALALMAATICKVFVYDVSSLDKGYRIVSFLVLGGLLMGISFVYQRDWLKLSKAPQGRGA